MGSERGRAACAAVTRERSHPALGQRRPHERASWQRGGLGGAGLGGSPGTPAIAWGSPGEAQWGAEETGQEEGCGRRVLGTSLGHTVPVFPVPVSDCYPGGSFLSPSACRRCRRCPCWTTLCLRDPRRLERKSETPPSGRCPDVHHPLSSGAPLSGLSPSAPLPSRLPCPTSISRYLPPAPLAARGSEGAGWFPRS